MLNHIQNVVSTLDDTLAAAQPALSAKTSHILQMHREKIAQTESTSSPWRDLARIASEEEDHSDQTEEGGEGIHDQRDGERRILRLDRRRTDGSTGIRDGGDGSLEKVKGWAEEVKNYLTSEIAVLNARQEAGEKKGRKWSLGMSFFGLFCFFVRQEVADTISPLDNIRCLDLTALNASTIVQEITETLGSGGG